MTEVEFTPWSLQRQWIDRGKDDVYHILWGRPDHVSKSMNSQVLVVGLTNVFVERSDVVSQRLRHLSF